MGFVLPVIVFAFVYYVGNRDVTLLEYIRSLQKLNVFIKLGSLCVFINSGAFLGMIKLKQEKTARGILGATIIYAFVVLISKAF